MSQGFRTEGRVPFGKGSRQAGKEEPMKRQGRCIQHMTRIHLFSFGILFLIVAVGGCGPSYQRLRLDGQTAMAQGSYGPARVFFIQAEEKSPRRADNLYDLGTCSVMLAREKFEQRNHSAAMRELDAATDYYSSAIEVNPGHIASLEGRNVALKLKGQFDEALRNAEWAVRYVGPSGKQFIYLANELEERGDNEGAILRYRQAVTVEPNNPAVHAAFAQFLLRHHNEAAAVHHLQAAYDLNPDDPWVSEELSRRGAIPSLASQHSAAP